MRRQSSSGRRRARASHGRTAAVAYSRPAVDVIATGCPTLHDDDVADGLSDDRQIRLVDTGDIPGGGELLLLRCGDDFSIQFGEDELMGTRDYLSEQALATMTCARLGRNDGHVLVGGLGMGFTLGAALDAWDSESTIVVAELVPQVVTWAKGPLAHISGVHIDNPRVSLKIGDVHDIIAEASSDFDAILLDVDNGPDGFLKPENDRLYCNWGLRAAYSALRPNGVLAVWSAYADPCFVERLEGAGFSVEETRIPAFAGSVEDWHSIWFASKPGGSALEQGVVAS